MTSLSNSSKPLEETTLFEVLSSTSETVYMLLDRLLFPGVDEFWAAFQTRQDTIWTPLYRNSKYDHLSDLSPILVDIKIGAPGETLYHWLVDQDENYPRFGFIGVSPLSFNDLRALWKPWLTCLYPNGDHALFRFYDPTVLQRVWPILKNEDQRYFLGKHSAIYLPHIVQERKTLSKLVDKTDFKESKTKPVQFHQFQLSQQQYDILFYEKRVRSLISSLHSQLAPDYAWLLPYQAVEARFREGLSIAAERYPNESTLAHETYATYRFFLSSDFDSHTQFQTLLKQYPLRKSIGRFTTMCQTHTELLNGYHQEDWLGISGKAELINE